MKYTTVSNLQWADAAHTAITADVTFEKHGTLPFGASSSDVEPHGREIFNRAVVGDFGPIAAFPLPNLLEVKSQKRAEIVNLRNEAITGGFTYMGKVIDSDRDSVMAITGASVAALAAKATAQPYSVIWTCADDSLLTLDADGVLGMAVVLAMFADVQHAKARPLKETIKNATDVKDVEKVKWK